MTRGKLISFEGIDGSGKSTQAERIYAHLRARGIRCELLREPGGTRLGELIRGILLSSAEEGLKMDGCTEYMLFAASRAELSRTVIRPLLEDGCTVLLDRFGDSSTAYQGYGHGVDIDFIQRTNLIVTGGLQPDLTILFDIDPEAALARLSDLSDRIEGRGLEFFRLVRDGFLKLAEKEPERFRIVDAGKDVEDVGKQVIRFVEELVGR